MSVGYAPTMNTVRVVKDNDVALPTEKRFGTNLADFDEIVVHVVLKNSATAATVEPHYWSDAAAAFLPLETPVTITAAGAGVRNTIRVDRSVSVFFEITGIAGGVATNDRVFVELSGVPAYHKVG